MKYIYLLCLTGMMCYACTSQQKEQENQEFSVSGDTIVVSSESPIAKKLKISEVQKELHETTFTVSGIVKAEKSTTKQSRKWNWLPRICAANRTCMHTK